MTRDTGCTSVAGGNNQMDRSAWSAHNVGKSVRALLERDQAVYIRQSGSTPCLSAIRRAHGIWLEDADGRRYMDFHGNSCHHIGYGHPRLIDAMKRQLDELPFTPRRFTDEPAVALAERLSALWPGSPGKVLLATGGSDVVEIALKLARVVTGHYKTISFYESYHGSGFGAISVGGRERDRPPRLGPLLPGALHVPPFYRRPNDASALPVNDEAWARACMSALEESFAREHNIAAVIAEPIRSTPHVPPAWFWPQVRQLCDRHRALLIFDEIATGLGKTGRLFVSEHFSVVPDITVIGKALGGAVVPIAAVIANPALDVAPELRAGHYTHEKNPLTARAALTTLQIIEDESLVERAANGGARALARLEDMAATQPLIRGVRGRGLLMAVELVEDIAESVMYRALAKGLSLSATEGRHLTLSPPLVITDQEMDSALSILERALAEEQVAGRGREP
jgi:(R)-1-hydroxy-2-aminoethylphosphonate ammonia-lyase